MRKRSTVWLLTVLALTTLGAGAAAAAEGDPGLPADPRLDMIARLLAPGPHPSLGKPAEVFGRLVGTWDVEYADVSKDGKVLHRTGELVIGWVLDGRAIQDIWVVNPWGSHTEREVFTDVRYFDPKSGTWPAIFVDPQAASVARFTGGAVGDDRIVLDSPDLGHEHTRWSFNEIRPDAFSFRDEASDDGGKSWRLQSDYHMKRRGAVAAGL